jgi:hypothetical protein
VSWEARGGRRCYTRTFRRDGRVVRQYCGTGAAAELAAQADALARAARAKQAEARRAGRVRWTAAELPLQELENVTDQLIRVALAAAGFHRHGGECRRKRNNHDRNAQVRKRVA